MVSCDTEQPDRCGDACVNLKSNQNHCGKCNQACKGAQRCVNGQCACPKGNDFCKGACVDLQTDKTNCGACGTQCNATEICKVGKCIPNCATGENACGKICVDLQNNRENCGSCGKKCPTQQHCSSGKCACVAGWSYCASKCVNISYNTENCGSCGKKCAAKEFCVQGTCQLCPPSSPQCGSVCCPKPFTCNKTTNTCLNLQGDINHCGKVNTKCTAGESCCSGTCINIISNAKHCGACGKACASGERCCNGVCTKVDSNAKHCGACGKKCPTGEACCKGACKQLANDPKNCSLCGNTCSSGGCCGGRCVAKVQTGAGPTGYQGVIKAGIEVCDGKDNDCDGFTDEGLTRSCYTGPRGTSCVGLCKAGTETCSAGSWKTCQGMVKPVKEACDGKDNDCNGKIDDGLSCKWVKTFGGTSILSNLKSHIKVDKNGNVYYVESFNKEVIFDKLKVTSTNGGVFITKMDSKGTVLWAKKITGARGKPTIGGLAIDASGNVFVTGNYTTDAVFDTLKVAPKAGTAPTKTCYITKLNTAGRFLWAKSIDGGQCVGVAADSSGNAYVTGTYNNTLLLGTGGNLKSQGSTDVWVARFNSSDGSASWVHSLGGTSTEHARAIVVDNKNRVYITGEYLGSIRLTTGQIPPLTSQGLFDIFLLQMDTSGDVYYARTLGGKNLDQVVDLAVDASQNVYLLGRFRSSFAIPGFLSLVAPTKHVATYIVTLSPTGKHVDSIAGSCTPNAGMSSCDLIPYQIALGSKGIYVTGTINGTVAFGKNQARGPTQDSFLYTRKASSSTNSLQRITGTSSNSVELVFGMAIGPKGIPHLAGYMNAPSIKIGSITATRKGTGGNHFVGQHP